jgi:hypothetical protein
MAVRVGDRGARQGISAVSTAAPAVADLPRPRQSARWVTPGASQRFVAATEQLDSCSLLDAHGLTALITAWACLDRSKRQLALVISNPSLMRVFEITDFDELFEIHPMLGAALNGSGNGHG